MAPARGSAVADAGGAGPAVESTRRRHLRLALSALVWLALGFTAVPFIASVSGGRGAAGPAPMRVRVGDLGVGQARRVPWGGRAVWILHRSPAQQAAASAGALRFGVFYADADGCAVVYRGPGEPPRGAPADWAGGFWNPCSGASYDASGRRLAGGAGAAGQLERPPFHLDGRGRLALGAG